MPETPVLTRRTLAGFVLGGVTGMLITVALLTPAPAPQAPAPADAEPPVAGTPAASPTDELADIPELAYPYGISGQVTDENGQGVSGARVVVRGDSIRMPREVQSDAQGRFEAPGLPLGMYTVEASAPQYRSAQQRGIGPGGPELSLVLEAQAGLVGRVLLDGEGVEGASVLIGGPGLFPPRHAQSGPDGTFALDDWDGAGVLEVVALTDSHGSGFGTQIALGQQQRVELTLAPAGPLVLAVTDGASQRYVEQGVVSISGGPLHVLSVSEPIENGRSRFVGLPAGTYYVRIQAPGYLRWSGEVSHAAPPEANRQPLRHLIRLSRGSTVSGRVLDTDGRPVDGAVVTAAIRDDLGRVWRRTTSSQDTVDRLVRGDGSPLWAPPGAVYSDGAGAFEVSGLPRGRILITVARDGFQPAQSERLELDGHSQRPGLQIRLERAAP